MKCLKPYIRANGLTSVSRNKNEGIAPFGCGQCLHCRINKARIWRLRIMLEAQANEHNSFITLTYNDENLETDSLVPRDLTLFHKRLRKHHGKFRYYSVGEYGDLSNRPHFHCIIFGFNPMYPEPIFKSWDKGFFKIGPADAGAMDYITGYVTKGMKKGHKDLKGRHPEFMRCSKMDGGLGLKTMEKIADEMVEKRMIPENWISAIGKNSNQPLGRYLQEKFNYALGKTDIDKKKHADEYEVSWIPIYQDKTKPYLDRILDNSAEKRRRELQRYKFKREKRSRGL